MEVVWFHQVDLQSEIVIKKETFLFADAKGFEKRLEIVSRGRNCNTSRNFKCSVLMQGYIPDFLTVKVGC